MIFKSNKRERWGLAPPDLRQGGDRPGPALGDQVRCGEKATFACCAGVTESLRASGPRKPGNHPKGKVNFPSRMIPWLSPDALHPGWRPKDAGPEAQRHQARFPRSSKLQRETSWFYHSSIIRYCGSRGIIPLVQVHEGRIGPRSVMN